MAPAKSAGGRGAKGKKYRPIGRIAERGTIGVRHLKGFEQARAHPREDLDIENLVQAQMMKRTKSVCSFPAKKFSSIDCMQYKGFSLQDKTCVSAEDLETVVARINGLCKGLFASTVDWAFAVLCQPARDVTSVQSAYRNFMRRLHPDKAGTAPAVVSAVELLREATSICEKTLSKQHAPSRPTQLRYTCICSDKGHKLLELAWTAPKACDSAPIHKYIIAVLDPSYGKALTIATLETDYSQKFGRYLTFDDPRLCSYLISEEDLRKMPKLFEADSLTIHVAAGNREGQSDWSTLRISLNKLKPTRFPNLD